MNPESKSRKSLTEFSNQFFANPKKRLYWHIAIISFMIISAYFREINYTFFGAFILKGSIVFLLIVLFYTNIYWLVPKFLFKRKYSTYILIAVLFAVVIYAAIIILMEVLSPYHFEEHRNTYDKEMSVPFFLFMIIVLIAASAAVRLFQQWVSDNKMIIELEKSRTTAELEQLKNQINPHFLFNMLNNANVLTKKDPEKASTVLMGLSDLLRYQLYDSTRDKVLLTADIHFLEDFLNLEKIRRDDFSFIVSKEGPINGKQVSPLLFVTFVENAVKHSNDTGKHTYVNLFFEVQDKLLSFKCVNSKPAIKAVSGPGGLGLENVKRRLKLLYPDQHELFIEESKDQFCVTLTLNL